MEEIWKDIEGFPGYQVSNAGRFINTKSGLFIKPSIDKTNGYAVFNLYDENGKPHRKYAHRVIAEAFIPNPENKRTVNHKDCNKTNYSIDNLEWATDSENMIHAFRNGLCENTRAAAYEQVKKLQAMPRTERQIEASRKRVAELHKLPMSQEKKDKMAKSHMDKHPPIRVVETDEICRSQKTLAEKLGVNDSAICACLHGRREHAGGYHFEYVTDKPIVRGPFLYDYQMDALKRLRNGSVLNGGVGSGKSRVGLFYYFKECGGWIDEYGYQPMTEPRDLYIITTAQKRNLKEWEGELVHFLMYGQDDSDSLYSNKIVVDSWNNVSKYRNVHGAFFLWDEQRVVGSGAWVKAFLDITRKNKWILLSATVGDVWQDYRPLFIANGFYKNKTEFNNEHLRYDPYCRNYPRVIGYMNESRLQYYRDQILVDMDFQRKTISHHEDIYVKYDINLYRSVSRTRTNPYKTVIWEDGSEHQAPIVNAAELCYTWRRIVNSDETRQVALLELLEKHPKAIVFYSYDYERDILLNLGYGDDVAVAEWSGHKHQTIPKTDKWVYLVNYAAGSCGWNCIETDTIIFFSQQYSYKTLEQARGRIDRLTTPFTDLWYYHLKSRSGIDLAISNALAKKKNFNESRWVKW